MSQPCLFPYQSCRIPVGFVSAERFVFVRKVVSVCLLRDLCTVRPVIGAWEVILCP